MLTIESYIRRNVFDGAALMPAFQCYRGMEDGQVIYEIKTSRKAFDHFIKNLKDAKHRYFTEEEKALVNRQSAAIDKSGIA